MEPALRSCRPRSRIKALSSRKNHPARPRPHDGQLRYVGGETRILLWSKSISRCEMMSKLINLVGRNVVVKYQLPDEDLDALISVVCDEDFQNMVDEYEKLEQRDTSAARLRLFLFCPAPAGGNHSSSQEVMRNMEQQYIEAVNGLTIQSSLNRKPPDPDQCYQQVHHVSSYSLKPGPLKMQRQLSASDRNNSSGFMCGGEPPGSHRNSPKTSPRATIQQVEDFSSVSKVKCFQDEVQALHHYYAAAEHPCPKQHGFNEGPEMVKICDKQQQQETDSPKQQKLVQQEQQEVVHQNGFIRMNLSPPVPWHHPCPAEVANRQLQYHPPVSHVQHRHIPPVNAVTAAAFCEQQQQVAAFYPPACVCRETRNSKPVLSPSRFREGVQQQHFHEQPEESRLRPPPQQQQQQVYEQGGHHRLIADKTGARVNERHLNPSHGLMGN